MKDYSRKNLEAYRPREDGLTTVNFCLEQLFNDDKHTIYDEVSKDLTYEELIGALLQARDMYEAIRDFGEEE